MIHTSVGSNLDIPSLDPLFRSSGLDIRGLRVPGSEAIETWKRLRAQVDETGHWPLLIGNEDSLDTLFEGIEARKDEEIGSIMQDGLELDFLAWLEHRRNQNLEYYTPPRGSWPQEEVQKDTYRVHFDQFAGQPISQMILILVPASRSWLVPAVLKFGGWNDCPPPEVHVAAFARWHKKYGADVVAITGDTIEFAVSEPPRSTEDALKLAGEQYLYCAESVSQGTGTLEGLAAALQNNHTWSFWWD